MPILEGCIGQYRLHPQNEQKIRVARPSILAPSQDLLDDYKNKKINWLEYEIRYRREIMKNKDAISRLKEIKRLSKTRTIRLLCYEKEYPCHRFILLDILKNQNRIKWITTTIKQKWLDKILSGEKTIEYKGATKFWMSRLNKLVGVNNGPICLQLICGNQESFTFEVEKVMRFSAPPKQEIDGKIFEHWFEIEIGKRLNI